MEQPGQAKIMYVFHILKAKQKSMFTLAAHVFLLMPNVYRKTNMMCGEQSVSFVILSAEQRHLH